MKKAIRIVELADKVYVKEVLEAARKYILRQVLDYFIFNCTVQTLLDLIKVNHVQSWMNWVNMYFALK